MTRSKSLLNKTSTTLALITSLQLVSSAAGNNRCPTEIAIQKKVVYATNCSTKGIAIATYSSEQGEKMCWFPVNCPMGAIRSDLPFDSDSTVCGKPCHCPSWASQCSFTKSDRILAFTASESCSPTKSIGVFNQVLLFDGTTT
ncbi:hypothetical protein Aduo_005585 [Ancylostoma duodenale]